MEASKNCQKSEETMEQSTSDYPEVDCLREKCQHLENEAIRLTTARQRLEYKVLVLQKQLCIEEQLVQQLKERRVAELKTLRRDYMEKFETAMNLLKVRVQVEMSHSLRRHKEQLKMSFRSDLLKLTRKNCQLTNLLRYIQQLQQLEQDTALKRRSTTSFCCGKTATESASLSSSSPQNSTTSTNSDSRFQTLRAQFQKQIAKLLDELKEREDGIDALNRNVLTISQVAKPGKKDSASLSRASSKEVSGRRCASTVRTSGANQEINYTCSGLSPSSSSTVAAASNNKPLVNVVVVSSSSNATKADHHQNDDGDVPCSSSHSVSTTSIKPSSKSSGSPKRGGYTNNNFVGPVRNKNHRGTRESRTSPYDTNQAAVSCRRKRCNDVLPSSFSSSASAHFVLSSKEKEEGAVCSSSSSSVQPPTTSYYYCLDSENQEQQDGNLVVTMRELDIPLATGIDCSQSYYTGHHHHHQQHNPYQNHHNVGHHQYHQQCGGSGLLETLPEAESEEEECDSISPSGGKSEELYRITRSPLVSSSSPSSSSSASSSSSESSPMSNASSPQAEFPPEFASLLEFGSGKLQVAKSLEDFGVLQQCERENKKISTLESIIRQLRDELKECKDQNELLEFRLLEMQELSSSPARPSQEDDDVDVEEEEEGEDEVEPKILSGVVNGNSNTDKVPCLPNSSDADFEGGNGHANVTESRSSCSDCSESLSLQESGIFDSQSTEDSPLSNVCRLTISRELVSLTFQIEELLRRFNEGVDESGSGSPGIIDSLCVSTRRGKTSHDLASELQSCRQRIQEFERRLAAMSDGNYIQGLEEKVNFLLNENRRLEDERAEIEEAENDNRLMCQRLEEKLGQLQKKKLVLQNRLATEKKCIEQLRLQVLQMQEKEEDLCSQITRLEGLLQNYEQRNFELEESCIEMKCSVQFVIHSIPIFALCYYGALLRSAQMKCSAGVNLLLRLTPSAIPRNDLGRFLQLTSSSSSSSSSTNNNALPVPDVSVSQIVSSRKHKLGELSNLEATLDSGDAVEPQLKKLRGLLDKSGIACFCDCAKCGSKLNTNDDDGSKEAYLTTATTTSVEAQTGEELWRQLLEQMFAEQRVEWQKAEKVLLKKIEILECDIDKCQEIFDQERANLIKMYEAKLAEKEVQLKETQACRSEKRDLQEKWNCLISELEQFAVYLGKNLSETACDEEGQSHPLFSKEQQGGAKWDGGSGACSYLVAAATGTEQTGVTDMSMITEKEDTENETRLASFISTSIIPYSTTSDCTNTVDSSESEVQQKTRLISYLQNSLREHLSTFEKREKHLLDEIDRLTREIRENVHSEEDSQQQGNMIAYLSQENERLMALFQDHEKVWGDLQQLQEEHEKLKLEVGNIVMVRKKLEETQKLETEMRDRLEELERTESQLKSQISQVEKREQKGLEKIQQLRDEIQFLRTKCCQLQDDIDGRVSREAKYKSEIQALTAKLKESSLELEEKESQLESNETALQTQIQKLKTQLGELHQAYADTECSNGMLREEVSYLERTVEEAIAKAVQSENTVTALSHELKQKDLTIEELQRKLEQLTTTETITGTTVGCSSSLPLSLSSAMNPNDLAVFNKNDGGLLGVARDVEEVVTLLQNQNIKDELVEATTNAATTTPEKSEETGNRPKPAKREEHGEEEDLMIAKLQETMGHLSLQIRNLEDAFYIRQKEMRDSYLSETSWWKLRCEEKNKLIELLGRRIAQLCVTDVHGFYLDGILREIEKVRESIATCHVLTAHSKETRELSQAGECSSFSSSSPPLYSSLPPTSTTTTTTMFSCSTSSTVTTTNSQYFCPIEPPPRKRSSKKKAAAAAASSVTKQNTISRSKQLLLSTDFTCDSLCSYLLAERQRVMAILEDALSENTTAVVDESHGTGESCNVSTSTLSRSNNENSDVGTAFNIPNAISPIGLEFRVLRKIGHDSLLVSWSTSTSTQENQLSPQLVNGYEIVVNGQVFLRIPQPNRQKVILFGLNLDEPLQLTLRCSAGNCCEESTITYIN